MKVRRLRGWVARGWRTTTRAAARLRPLLNHAPRLAELVSDLTDRVAGGGPVPRLARRPLFESQSDKTRRGRRFHSLFPPTPVVRLVEHEGEEGDDEENALG